LNFQLQKEVRYTKLSACRNPKCEICFEPAPGEMLLLPWGLGALIHSGYEFNSSEFCNEKKEAIHEYQLFWKNSVKSG